MELLALLRAIKNNGLILKTEESKASAALARNDGFVADSIWIPVEVAANPNRLKRLLPPVSFKLVALESSTIINKASKLNIFGL